MRVLVTGNRGYLGYWMVSELLENGFDVKGLDSDLYCRCDFPFVKKNQNILQIPFLAKDVRDVTIEDLDGIDAVIHLAGLSNDPLGDIDPELTIEINQEASIRLASISKAAGVKRFVAASSCSVYGAGNNEFLTEESPLKPVTVYAETKLGMEQGISLLGDDNFSPVFMRCGTVYGLAPRMRFDLVVNNLLAWAVNSKQVYLKSNGQAWRPIIHVRDVARAFAAVLGAPADQISNQKFNVVDSQENYRVKELAEIINERVRDSKITYSNTPESDIRNYRVSGDKLSALLGNEWCQISLLEGINELIEAFKKSSPTSEEFEGPKYQRVAHLTSLFETGELDDNLRVLPQTETRAS